MELDQDSFLSVNFDSFENCYSTAKHICLTEQDIEFLEEVELLSTPLNPRHESASLSLVLRKLTLEGQSSSSPFWSDYKFALERSNEVYKNLSPVQGNCSLINDTESAEEKLRSWIISNGGSCDLLAANITMGDRQIRGLVSPVDLDPASCPLMIPESLLISDQTAVDSELGVALIACGVTKGDLLTVIWTMIDAYDEESPNKLLWNTLPKECISGLGFSKQQTEWLEGTSAGMELNHAQEHLRKTYTSIEPLLKSLKQAYPDFVTTKTISYENYLWATQIWYSYAMEIEMKNNEVCSCLVPFASLMNHSSWPHCVRYGRLNRINSSLEFPLFRGCKSHEQLLLSYGALPNQKLLIYYGFVLRNNPFDFVSLESKIMEELDAMETSQKQLCLKRMEEQEVDLSQKIMAGALPKKLVSCAKIFVRSRNNLEDLCSESSYQDLRLKEEAYEKIRSWLESIQRTLLTSTVWTLQNDDKVSELCKEYLLCQIDTLRIRLQSWKPGPFPSDAEQDSVVRDVCHND